MTRNADYGEEKQLMVCHACRLSPCRSLASADRRDSTSLPAARASRIRRVFILMPAVRQTTRPRDRLPNYLNYDSRVPDVLEDIRTEKYSSFREASTKTG